MIAIGRSLPFNNHEIFYISAQRIILLQIENSLLDFFSSILDLLTNCISLRKIILGRFRVILHEIIKREFTLLIVHLNFENMFEVIFIELEIFGVYVINRTVDRHNFLVLIFELF